MEVDYGTVKAVQDSWDAVLQIPNVTQVAGELLFRSIFRILPGAWKLFPFGKGFEQIDDAMFTSPEFQKHAKNVVSMLDTAVQFLGPDLQVLEEQLVSLGARHVRYGVLPEHYPVVGQALLETLATALGDKFTPSLKEAWTGVYGFVTTNMLKGANECLLRLKFPCHGMDAGTNMSLDQYVSSMLPSQKQLFFVDAKYPSEEVSQTLEKLDKTGVTVLLLGKTQSDKVVANLEKYLGRKMVNVNDTERLDLSFLETDEPAPKAKKEPRRNSPTSVTHVQEGLGMAQAEDFCAWFQEELGIEKVVACTPTCRFASLPARVIRHKGEDMQKALQTLDDFDCMPLPKKHVEINPAHEMIVEIDMIRRRHPEMARLLAEQVYDNCLINAGIMEDSRSMVNRINQICMGWMKEKNRNSEEC
ncbi:shock protein 75 kDa, mitochondrial [Seminavis robusta]|uniref:Shock protein 75 kDa, mitochondrial n=1 Tax=Seminavis robusta TaxID=568900 RepID=A0A9N8D703_9STRA|nr:shock protein 75 kDa, mitochondrial [Seminavis robusta]|eukprot:Sro3_g002870.1 shock protein 75 kDa, mitochondrial (416) ;mRNA; f:264472-265830